MPYRSPFDFSDVNSNDSFHTALSIRNPSADEVRVARAASIAYMRRAMETMLFQLDFDQASWLAGYTGNTGPTATVADMYAVLDALMTQRAIAQDAWLAERTANTGPTADDPVASGQSEPPRRNETPANQQAPAAQAPPSRTPVPEAPAPPPQAPAPQAPTSRAQAPTAQAPVARAQSSAPASQDRPSAAANTSAGASRNDRPETQVAAPPSQPPTGTQTRAPTGAATGGATSQRGGSSAPQDSTRTQQPEDVPIFDKSRWAELRKRNPTLPNYRSTENLGKREERDTDLWIGARFPHVVKVSSKVMVEKLPYFTIILEQGSKARLRGHGGAPRYSVVLSVNTNRQPRIKPTRQIGELVDDEGKAHTRNFREAFCDLLGAIHDYDVQEVKRFARSMLRMSSYFRSDEAVREILARMDHRQYGSLKDAASRRPKEFLQLAILCRSRFLFSRAFYPFVRDSPMAFTMGLVEEYVKDLPSGLQFSVIFEVGKFKSTAKSMEAWRKAWKQIDTDWDLGFLKHM
ncbi:uncharacterized protein K452DRAFT_317663 [Aplosporella prunicola CBS 121167]|uniref:Uncharacterized protein n=1 Tax=Aplosporella prunicola CBS 121167 TaxID=1176127 RepID=A0A6A6BEW9_9PEZI|nr:uncharacterized protein K452DRAFT_317663 [Aplosporella prunicola CBS 121167]KAF2142719.1 hypothetical protein K452DRAFT_317663 [Aplosporella prunicola CBS 121167]